MKPFAGVRGYGKTFLFSFHYVIYISLSITNLVVIFFFKSAPFKPKEEPMGLKRVK